MTAILRLRLPEEEKHRSEGYRVAIRAFLQRHEKIPRPIGSFHPSAFGYTMASMNRRASSIFETTSRRRLFFQMFAALLEASTRSTRLDVHLLVTGGAETGHSFVAHLPEITEITESPEGPAREISSRGR